MRDDEQAETLFPFQEEGATWLTSKRHALLADEMGLGKSAQAIVAADRIRAERILVLCPASVRTNWIRQFERWSVLERSISAVSNGRARPSTNIIVCSYDLLLDSALLTTLLSSPRDALILDEVHYLKSTDAKRTHAVFGRGGLVHRAAATWALSGTPAPNHAGELYPLLRVFGVPVGSWESYVARFCTTRHTPFGRQITGSKEIPALRALLAPILLRRKKEDVMRDLPKISFESVVVEAGPVDEELMFPHYSIPKRLPELHRDLEKQRAVLDGAFGLASPGSRDGLTVLSGIADSVSTLRKYVGLQKVPAILDIIKGELEFGAYDKIVLFAIHRDVIETLREGLKPFKPVAFYGGMPDQKKHANLEKFQKDPKCRVFIGNIKAAGTGVDGLQHAAHHVAFVECMWSPADNAQAAMRVHRIGQTKPVFVRVFGLANSIDERVQVVLRRKIKDLTALFDSPE